MAEIKKPKRGFTLLPNESFCIQSGPENMPSTRLYPNLSSPKTLPSYPTGSLPLKYNPEETPSIDPKYLADGPLVVTEIIPPVASP